MITKTCEQCHIVFTCHQKRVRYCSRCHDKQAYRQKTNPVTAGYAHTGDGITPVPQAVLDRIANEKLGTANNGILSFAFPARQIEALEEELTALQEWAEEIAQQRRQEKPVQRGIETCPVCGRGMTEYGCIRHCQ